MLTSGLVLRYLEVVELTFAPTAASKSGLTVDLIFTCLLSLQRNLQAKPFPSDPDGLFI